MLVLSLREGSLLGSTFLGCFKYSRLFFSVDLELYLSYALKTLSEGTKARNEFLNEN